MVERKEKRLDIVFNITATNVYYFIFIYIAGDARVVMIGFPSVGKSTLLTKITDQESIAAGYEFTTLTCVPGKIQYNGATIQLLDLPGIIGGASQGKGRGKQVISVARTADIVLMMLDATKSAQQRYILKKNTWHSLNTHLFSYI